jgi:hypothetical protein
MNRQRNGIPVGPLLPECARGVNQIVKSRAVFPLQARSDQQGGVSSEKQRTYTLLGKGRTSELGRNVMFLMGPHSRYRIA